MKKKVFDWLFVSLGFVAGIVILRVLRVVIFG